MFFKKKISKDESVSFRHDIFPYGGAQLTSQIRKFVIPTLKTHTNSLRLKPKYYSLNGSYRSYSVSNTRPAFFLLPFLSFFFPFIPFPKNK